MEFSKRIVGVMLFAGVLSAVSVLSAGDKKPSSVGPQQVKAKVLAEFDIPRDGSDLITVPITLKSGTYRFLLDMESTHSLFDVTLRDQLGGPLGKNTITLTGGQTRTVSYFRWPDAKIGKMPVNLNAAVMFTNTRNVRLFWRLPIYGSLGLDFWKKHVIRIDSDRGKMTILSAAPSDSGTRIPIEFSKGGQPLITVKLPGKQEIKCLLVPKLFATMLLHPDQYNKLVSQGHMHTTERSPYLPSVFGKWYEVGGTLDQITVGKFTHRAVNVVSAINTDNYGAVGLKFFARYRVTLDLANKCLYLKKGTGFDRSDYGQHSGMICGMKSSDKSTTITVQNVLDGTPAQKAGFQPGDIITRISNEDVNKLSIFRIYETFAIFRKVTMTVKRDNKELSLTIIPEDEPKKKVKLVKKKTAKRK